MKTKIFILVALVFGLYRTTVVAQDLKITPPALPKTDTKLVLQKPDLSASKPEWEVKSVSFAAGQGKQNPYGLSKELADVILGLCKVKDEPECNGAMIVKEDIDKIVSDPGSFKDKFVKSPAATIPPKMEMKKVSVSEYKLVFIKPNVDDTIDGYAFTLNSARLPAQYNKELEVALGVNGYVGTVKWLKDKKVLILADQKDQDIMMMMNVQMGHEVPTAWLVKQIVDKLERDKEENVEEPLDRFTLPRAVDDYMNKKLVVIIPLVLQMAKGKYPALHSTLKALVVEYAKKAMEGNEDEKTVFVADGLLVPGLKAILAAPIDPKQLRALMLEFVARWDSVQKKGGAEAVLNVFGFDPLPVRDDKFFDSFLTRLTEDGTYNYSIFEMKSESSLHPGDGVGN